MQKVLIEVEMEEQLSSPVCDQSRIDVSELSLQSLFHYGHTSNWTPQSETIRIQKASKPLYLAARQFFTCTQNISTSRALVMAS